MSFRTISQSSIGVAKGALAQQLVVGDLNGDRIPDLVIPNIIYPTTAKAEVKFVLGRNDGTFFDATGSLFAVDRTVPMMFGASRMISGDFNSDGKTDVIGINQGNDLPPYLGDQSTLYLSTANGMRDATALLPQKIKFGHGGAVGDIDRDGDLDAIIFNIITTDGYAIEVLVNDGQGRMTFANNSAPLAYQNLDFNPGSTAGSLVDLNGDGALDLVVGRWHGSQRPSEVYLNDGRGSFSSATPIALPATDVPFESVMQVTPTDVNGDGRLDLILSVTNGLATPTLPFYSVSRLQVLVNQGKGVFTDETASRIVQSQPEKGWGKFVQNVDINGDAENDILFYMEGAAGRKDYTRVYLNDGAGHYTPVATTVAGLASVVQNFAGGTSPALVSYTHDGTITVSAIEFPRPDPNAPRTYESGVGDQKFIGRGGTDSVVYKELSRAFSLNVSSERTEVVKPSGVDTLSSIERLQFLDGTLALDTSGNAGQVYRLYQAAFARTPDTAGLKHNIGLVDGGLTLAQMSSAFLASAEFQQKYGANPTDTAYINALYRNVLGRDPDPAGQAGWQALLNDGSWSRTTLLIGFSESPENISNLAPAINNGIWLA